MLTEETIRSIGTRIFEQRYTADRIAAVAGLGFLRWGEPLVNAFARVAEADDRGKAFAIEVQRPTGEPDREPWIAFCLDITVGPARSVLRSRPGWGIRPSSQARTGFFLPTTVERVWWIAGRGECRPRVARDLDQSRGENLGSRPARFRELTAPLDWPGVCDEALGHALAAVRERTA